MYLCFGVTARDRRVGPFQKIFLQVDIYVQSNNYDGTGWYYNDEFPILLNS
jgi:hypothetical protein